MELAEVSRAMATAAAAGRWDEVSHYLWRRADLLDELTGADAETLQAALEAGDKTYAAVRRLRAGLEMELQNLRAARRSARAWRPYREPAGGLLDVSS